MIADIYNCPQCGRTVYLSQDETCCPLCVNDIGNMEVVEQGVDLEEDSKLDDPKYAHFDHLVEILQHHFGDEVIRYLLDCWLYAWDATKTDMANAPNITAFINNPNEFLCPHKEPMDFDALSAEVEKQIRLGYKKCCFPNSWEEDDKAFNYTHSVCKMFAKFYIYVKKDNTDVFVAVAPLMENYQLGERLIFVDKDKVMPDFSDYKLYVGCINTSFVWRKIRNKVPRYMGIYVASHQADDCSFWNKLRAVRYKIKNGFSIRKARHYET